MNGDKILSSAIAAEADANDEPSAELFRQKAHHAMNWLMLPAWNTLGEQPVPPNSNQGIQRRHDLTNAQHGIAVLAGLFYHLREQHVLEDPDYINPEKACSQRNAIEGVMHELDTAYLGLRFAITHPGVSIVPGPIQFEKMQVQVIQISLWWILKDILLQDCKLKHVHAKSIYKNMMISWFNL